MEIVALLVEGLEAGVVSTAFMTAIQTVFWKKWGLSGVLEWHENQMIWRRLRGSDRSTLSFFGIFSLHFLNGGLAAAPFPLVVALLPSLTVVPLVATGVLYGILLWILTLFPIHRPITGVWLTNHPQGFLPVAASFLGHLIYGVSLSLLIVLMI